MQKRHISTTSRFWMFLTARHNSWQHFSLANKAVLWKEMDNPQQLLMCLDRKHNVTVRNLCQSAAI